MKKQTHPWGVTLNGRLILGTSLTWGRDDAAWYVELAHRNNSRFRFRLKAVPLPSVIA